MSTETDHAATFNTELVRILARDCMRAADEVESVLTTITATWNVDRARLVVEGDYKGEKITRTEAFAPGTTAATIKKRLQSHADSIRDEKDLFKKGDEVHLESDHDEEKAKQRASRLWDVMRHVHAADPGGLLGVYGLDDRRGILNVFWIRTPGTDEQRKRFEDAWASVGREGGANHKIYKGGPE